MSQHILYESASGYALFELVESEEVAALHEQVQSSVTDLERFSKIVKLKAFQPFKSAEDALSNVNHVSEGVLDDSLRSFLDMNLPKVKKMKKAKFSLGVVEPKIGSAVQDEMNIPCRSDETILEIIRGIRMHFDRYVKALSDGNLEKAQLGMAHSYSRAKVKFNVNRADNMIIQSISLLDQLDKDLNTFAMRVREWYSWHFPELVKLVPDNYAYARCAQLIGNRSTLDEEKQAKLAAIVMDEELAEQVVAASRASMGMDVSEVDMLNVDRFTTRLVKLAEYRQQLHTYLSSRMEHVAPNLSALIGDVVAARLIAHAGSLTNLAKCPASTVQILGAEKALFRALKTKGNTPKYGLIFHSSFIGRAAAKNKGRISRYLANKCAIAARIDSFSDAPSSAYGEKMKEQVEQRLEFYDTGVAPAKNMDVMEGVAKDLAAAAKKDADAGNDLDSDDEMPAMGEAATPKKDKKKKDKKKKDKKKKAVEEEDDEDEEPVSAKKSRKRAAPTAVEEIDDDEEEDAEDAPKAKKVKKVKKKKKKSTA